MTSTAEAITVRMKKRAHRLHVHEFIHGKTLKQLMISNHQLSKGQITWTL